jgi:hypothetical protein
MPQNLDKKSQKIHMNTSKLNKSWEMHTRTLVFIFAFFYLLPLLLSQVSRQRSARTGPCWSSPVQSWPRCFPTRPGLSRTYPPMCRPSACRLPWRTPVGTAVPPVSDRPRQMAAPHPPPELRNLPCPDSWRLPPDSTCSHHRRPVLEVVDMRKPMDALESLDRAILQLLVWECTHISEHSNSTAQSNEECPDFQRLRRSISIGSMGTDLCVSSGKAGKKVRLKITTLISNL